jgi:hypothetical protein
MTYLDERSDRRRDLHLTTNNAHKEQASMLPARFKPTIPASERPQTKALDRAATGIGKAVFVLQMCLFLRDYWYYVSVKVILLKKLTTEVQT